MSGRLFGKRVATFATEFEIRRIFKTALLAGVLNVERLSAYSTKLNIVGEFSLAFRTLHLTLPHRIMGIVYDPFLGMSNKVRYSDFFLRNIGNIQAKSDF